MAKRINWEKLKRDYLTGDVESVSEFVRQKTSKETAKNNSVATKTKGWSEERKELQMEATEKAKKELLEEITVSHTGLLLAKQRALRLIEKRLDELEEAEIYHDKEFGIPVFTKNIAAIEKVLNIIKTELAEPTSLSKVNSNLSLPPDEFFEPSRNRVPKGIIDLVLSRSNVDNAGESKKESD